MEVVGENHYECDKCGHKAANAEAFMGHDCPAAENTTLVNNQLETIIDRLDIIIELMRNRL